MREYRATVPGDNPPDVRQPHPRAFELIMPVQALKHTE